MYPVEENHHLLCVTELQIAKHADTSVVGNIDINPRTAHLIVNSLLRDELNRFLPAVQQAAFGTLMALQPDLAKTPEFERATFIGYSHRYRKVTFPGMERYDAIAYLQPLLVWTALINVPSEPPHIGTSDLIIDPTRR